MTIQLSKFVEPDLRTIGNYIAIHNPRRARTFVQELRDKFLVIGSNPEIYRIRPDLGETARLVPHGRYVILFRIIPTGVRIERVLSGYRDIPKVIRA